MNPEDIGSDVQITYWGWSPDRELNPQYDGIPDIEKYGILIDHKTPEGRQCSSFAVFDTEDVRKLQRVTADQAHRRAAGSPERRQQDPGGRAVWQVETWEPLTISPSVLCRRCGHHGFIRNGLWEAAA